jgi:hypothetical protein
MRYVLIPVLIEHESRLNPAQKRVILCILARNLWVTGHLWKTQSAGNNLSCTLVILEVNDEMLKYIADCARILPEAQRGFWSLMCQTQMPHNYVDGAGKRFAGLLERGCDVIEARIK